MKTIIIIIFSFSFSLQLGIGAYINTKSIKVSTLSSLTKVRLIIRYKESSHNYAATGAKGEIGAYQFMQRTWDYLCIKYYNKVLIPTKENQDKIAIRYIKELHDSGYSIPEIASTWNCGKRKPSNNTTKKYLKHFKKLYHENTSNINKLLKYDY